MRFCFSLIAALQCQLVLVSGLISLDSIRNLTVMSNELRGRIVRTGEVGVGVEQVVLGLEGGGFKQGKGEEGEDKQEIEDTIAASLSLLSSSLLVELQKPLGPHYLLTHIYDKSGPCPQIINEYHKFLASIVKLLHEIQERQIFWSWGRESSIFDGLAWLQGLWASRRTNTTNRSFIEQQMDLYKQTGCFGKSQEVLKRNVEVVEFINDMIDDFN